MWINCIWFVCLGIGEWRTSKTDMSELSVSCEHMAHVQTGVRLFSGDTEGLVEQTSGTSRARKG